MCFALCALKSKKLKAAGIKSWIAAQTICAQMETILKKQFTTQD